MTREDDTRRLYAALDRAAQRFGLRELREWAPADRLPRRGVYFFFDAQEPRSGSGSGLRVVRVGTHGLKAGAVSTLPGRLAQHKGSHKGGNHRGSIFRLLAGQALAQAGQCPGCVTWGLKKGALDAVVGIGVPRSSWIGQEQETEAAVSRYLGRLHFAFVPIDDEPGPESLRGVIERNSIALLSSLGRDPIDPPSSNWLGLKSNRSKVRGSGLWNSDHVDEGYDPGFLNRIEAAVDRAV